ncbi:hypothetical protein ACS125_18630 [Acinetobacter sp. PFS20]|uniref:hypothetical protein n=1 Tax=Acinetobacter sp. PFS20 TaxID=3458434 RepID=UPI003FD61266
MGLKEPVMSEFKEFKAGDKVVFKYGSMPKDLMTIEFVSLDGSCVDVFEDFNPILSEVLDYATTEEIAAGHRIDEVVPVYADVKFPYNVLTGEQVGAVMNATHFSYDLGDDFPIENHISPNCNAKDV